MRSVRALRTACCMFACTVSAWAEADVVLVPAGSVWKYLDDGSDQGIAWRESVFDDSAWAEGPAQLGYGDGDEVTVVSYGNDPNNKYITTYFRRTFDVADPTGFTSLRVRVVRDDGAIVYINGLGMVSSNMPSGPINYLTPASTAVSGSSESTFYQFDLPPGILTPGENVVAVELHQSSGTSSDISFDCELLGTDLIPDMVRGPYLQLGGPTSIVVRWRTDLPADGVVRYGPAPDDLSHSVSAADPTTEHAVALASLTPATRYYYAVESGGNVLAGGDHEHTFVTSPGPGSRSPVRVWAIGDSGTANQDARDVRDAFLAFSAARPADLWLMLGDNAYDDGTDAEYQAAVFETYPSMLRTTPLWATLGNHDGHTANSATESGPYYDVFTLPREGEIGGVASGTEAYYSFDYANIHFICLESFETNRLPTGAMLTWLQADLDATNQEWIVAFWHHPPYTKGSHNSDSEPELVQMRGFALPILEAGGVDLVLCGHSHSYERSYLLDGHYGLSTTLDPEAMILDGGDGREDGDGAYTKHTLADPAHRGAVYAVAGSSGKISGGALNHPAMFVSLNELGSMVLDFDAGRLDAVFLTHTGEIHDRFTLLKLPCPVDFAPDGVLDFYDVQAFLNLFASGNPAADLNGDEAFDFFDVQIFLADFANACL